MDLFIVFILALAGLLFVLRRESGAAAAVSVLVVVGIIGLFMGTGWFSLLLFIGAGITALAGLPGIRSQWLTPRAFAMFKKVAPKVSATEQEALDAGTVGWDGEIFTGRPDWQKLLSNRDTGLSEDEQAFVDNQCSVAASMCNAWDIGFERADLPKELWDYLKKERFFGMIIPKEYGGLGLSARAQSAVLQKLSMNESLMVSVGVPTPSARVNCCSNMALTSRRTTICHAWPMVGKSPVSASPARAPAPTPPPCRTPASSASRKWTARKWSGCDSTLKSAGSLLRPSPRSWAWRSACSIQTVFWAARRTGASPVP